MRSNSCAIGKAANGGPFLRRIVECRHGKVLLLWQF
jgi:hypothetical protein